MAKQKYERTKPHINIGTIGHVDHGRISTSARSATLTTAKRLLQQRSHQYLTESTDSALT